MLRAVLVLLVIGFASAAGNPVFAQKAEVSAERTQLVGQIEQALQLPELTRIMAEEALVDAKEQFDPEVSQQDQQEWLSNLGRLNEAGRLQQLLTEALTHAVSSSSEGDLRRALEFYRSPLGKRVVGLELSARRAMIEPDGRSAAEEAYARSGATAPARRQQLEDLIDAGDVIETSVASGMNAYLAATRGFQAALGESGSDRDITETWAQETEIRDEVGTWVRGLLFLAYGPLSDADIDRLIDFMESPQGQVLADTVLQAFDQVFTRVAYETGMASAARFAGEEL